MRDVIARRVRELREERRKIRNMAAQKASAIDDEIAECEEALTPPPLRLRGAGGEGLQEEEDGLLLPPVTRGARGTKVHLLTRHNCHRLGETRQHSETPVSPLTNPAAPGQPPKTNVMCIKHGYRVVNTDSRSSWSVKPRLPSRCSADRTGR